MSNDQITVSATIHAPIPKVWAYWNDPKHIREWNQASADWHCPKAENDLRAGGKFFSRMEAKDGSMGFDFSGVYDEVKDQEFIKYTMDDGRKVAVSFSANGNQTLVTETFEAENRNPADMQRNGWQAILNSFKAYTEGHT
ncbi:MAG TPA: SRPBCC family protein [Edaphocola sp.]|nr:SRPBCC family protein [Edaphocola sp.]